MEACYLVFKLLAKICKVESQWQAWNI